MISVLQLQLTGLSQNIGYSQLNVFFLYSSHQTLDVIQQLLYLKVLMIKKGARCSKNMNGNTVKV